MLFGALKPVVAGLAVGVVASLALTRALDRLVYGISTTDPMTFISLPIVLGVVAFIAGLLLAETQYRRAVEAMIDPFRGLLLGVFFFSVGMHIDLAFIWREPLLVAGAFLGMIVAKTVLVAPLCRLFGIPWAASVETSLLLAPGGEAGRWSGRGSALLGLPLALHLLGVAIGGLADSGIGQLAIAGLVSSAGRNLGL